MHVVCYTEARSIYRLLPPVIVYGRPGARATLEIVLHTLVKISYFLKKTLYYRDARELPPRKHRPRIRPIARG